jgi:WD40 repeat protein
LIWWDVATGAVLHRFIGHTDLVWSVAIHPEGHLALSGSGDDTMRLWSLSQTQDEFIAWVHANRYVPEVTCAQREQYRVEPYCKQDGTFPTRTPYPTLSTTLAPD